MKDPVLQLHPKQNFSDVLEGLVKSYSESPVVSFEQIQEYLADRSSAALVIVLAAPMITPIPMPGISMTLGVVIAILAKSIVMRRPAKFPNFIAKKTIEYRTLCKIIAASTKVLRKFEKFLKNRNQFFLNGSARQFAMASFIASGVAIALPLPPVILFSNSIPAIAVLLLAFGFLEDDGTFVLAGHCMTIFTWCYFAAWSNVIYRSAKFIFERYF